MLLRHLRCWYPFWFCLILNVVLYFYFPPKSERFWLRVLGGWGTVAWVAVLCWRYDRQKWRELHQGRTMCQWRFVRNVYGDEINDLNGARSVWLCKYCGSMGLGDRLFMGKDQDLTGSVVVHRMIIGLSSGHHLAS